MNAFVNPQKLRAQPGTPVTNTPRPITGYQDAVTGLPAAGATRGWIPNIPQYAPANTAAPAAPAAPQQPPMQAPAAPQGLPQMAAQFLPKPPQMPQGASPSLTPPAAPQSPAGYNPVTGMPGMPQGLPQMPGMFQGMNLQGLMDAIRNRQQGAPGFGRQFAQQFMPQQFMPQQFKPQLGMLGGMVPGLGGMQPPGLANKPVDPNAAVDPTGKGVPGIKPAVTDPMKLAKRNAY